MKSEKIFNFDAIQTPIGWYGGRKSDHNSEIKINRMTEGRHPNINYYSSIQDYLNLDIKFKAEGYNKTVLGENNLSSKKFDSLVDKVMKYSEKKHDKDEQKSLKDKLKIHEDVRESMDFLKKEVDNYMIGKFSEKAPKDYELTAYFEKILKEAERSKNYESEKFDRKINLYNTRNSLSKNIWDEIILKQIEKPVKNYPGSYIGDGFFDIGEKVVRVFQFEKQTATYLVTEKKPLPQLYTKMDRFNLTIELMEGSISNRRYRFF